MKRILLTLIIVLLSHGTIFAQDIFFNPTLNIEGVLKKDYQNATKGTPVVLQRIAKLKATPYNGNYETQAVIVANGVQLGIPISRLDIIDLHPDSNNAFWQIAQLSNGLISYYDKKGYQEIFRQEQAEEADEYLKELAQSQLLYEIGRAHV